MVLLQRIVTGLLGWVFLAALPQQVECIGHCAFLGLKEKHAALHHRLTRKVPVRQWEQKAQGGVFDGTLRHLLGKPAHAHAYASAVAGWKADTGSPNRPG